jgi:hypothetical protein
MKGQRDLSSDIESLLEDSRGVPRVPDVVRARALARARAAMATAAAPAPDVVARHWRGLRFAVAACVALALGAAGAVAALHGRLPGASESTPSEATPPTLPARDARVGVAAPSEIAPEPTVIAKSQRSPRPATPQESYAAELALLQRAHATYAVKDFSGTLAVVAEHARRFPNGRLSEEREGLRVESLAGSGRRDETRRAVAAFARRFPRSVLLPRLREMAHLSE